MRDSFLYPSIIDGKKNPPNWVSNQQKKFAKSSTNSPYNFHIILNRPRAFDDYSAPRLAACEETRAAGHEKTRHCMLVLSISSVRNSKIHGFLRLLWKKMCRTTPMNFEKSMGHPLTKNMMTLSFILGRRSFEETYLFQGLTGAWMMFSCSGVAVLHVWYARLMPGSK